MSRFRRLGAGIALTLVTTLSFVPIVSAQEATPDVAPVAVEDLELSGIKTYLTEHVDAVVAGNAILLEMAQRYYEQAEASNFDYQAMWDQSGSALAADIEQAREVWITQSSGNYELSEGIVAGVPSLTYYDLLLDAGPSGEEDPANALDNEVTLPDGTVLSRPGSFYHHLTEPALWGTDPEHVGLAVDFDGNGTIEIGEALPDANFLLGTMQGLNQAGLDLQAAVSEWTPNPQDAFTALLTMVPTMNGYFDDWKNSPFILGQDSTAESFVAVSRLVDVAGILNGLLVTYDNVKPAVVTVNPELAAQIDTGLDEMMAFVTDIHAQEDSGTRFTPEQADIFAGQIEEMSAAVAGQVTQAMALLGIEPAS
ncbi:MAG: imelysin family protein [Thermomicrobiales bacterium]